MNIVFVGDVMLGRLVNATLKVEPPEYPWGDTLPIFSRGDVRLCNLECVLSDRGTPWSRTPKVFHFRSDAKNIAVLQRAQIDLVSVANNHTLDFDYEAMLDMLHLLGHARIRHAGAGAQVAEASRVAIAHIHGARLGLVAFTDNEPEWAATDRSPGLFYVPINVADRRAKRLFDIVGRAKGEVDLLIVSAHWGPNWGYSPPANHPPFAKALIDAGADLIFGHSGHVFRGIELYQQRPIVYCTGNFIDDYAVDEIERNDQSFLFVAETEKNQIRTLKLYPTVIRNCQARLAGSPEREEIIQKMQHLCAQLHTRTCWQKDGYLEIEIT
jgi:poly-gamma-glutamate synthesis protein (capsule biosynthesis protein)